MVADLPIELSPKTLALNNNQGLDWIKLAGLLLDSATLMRIIYPEAILLRVIRFTPGTAPSVGSESYDGQTLRYQLKPRDSISTLHLIPAITVAIAMTPDTVIILVCFSPLYVGMVLFIPVLLRIPLNFTV